MNELDPSHSQRCRLRSPNNGDFQIPQDACGTTLPKCQVNSISKSNARLSGIISHPQEVSDPLPAETESTAPREETQETMRPNLSLPPRPPIWACKQWLLYDTECHFYRQYRVILSNRTDDFRKTITYAFLMSSAEACLCTPRTS